MQTTRNKYKFHYFQFIQFSAFKNVSGKNENVFGTYKKIVLTQTYENGNI